MGVHLAARAGVRPSLEDPLLYVKTNVWGTTHLLERARLAGVRHFVYASSSSVYGGSTAPSFSESDRGDGPVSPYAATKKATELMAYTFNHLYNLPVAGLRFFTVYGPSGRPDMAPAKFLTRAATGVPIDQYGNGSSERDYTMSMTLSLVLCAHWTGRLLIPRCTTWGTGGPSRSNGSSRLWARPSRPPLRL